MKRTVFMKQEHIEEKRKEEERIKLAQRSMCAPLEQLLQDENWCSKIDMVMVDERVKVDEEKVRVWYGYKKKTRKVSGIRITVQSKEVYERAAWVDWSYTDIDYRQFFFEDKNEALRLVEIMKKRLPLVCVEE